MKELLEAINLVEKYEKMDIDLLVSEFSNYTNQEIPTDVVKEFRYTGLSNIDFLTSDFLNKYGFKNLLQYEKQNTISVGGCEIKSGNKTSIELELIHNLRNKYPDSLYEQPHTKIFMDFIKRNSNVAPNYRFDLSEKVPKPPQMIDALINGKASEISKED